MNYCPECGSKNLQSLSVSDGLSGRKKGETVVTRGSKWAAIGAIAGVLLPGAGALAGALLGSAIGLAAGAARFTCSDCGHRW
jgi:hypothetical protein